MSRSRSNSRGTGAATRRMQNDGGRTGKREPLSGAIVGWRAATRGDRPGDRAAPAALLADEPTGNLDAATGSEIVDLLRARDQSVRAVVITHDPSIAERAERVTYGRRTDRVNQALRLAGRDLRGGSVGSAFCYSVSPS